MFTLSDSDVNSDVRVLFIAENLMFSGDKKAVFNLKELANEDGRIYYYCDFLYIICLIFHKSNNINWLNSLFGSG